MKATSNRITCKAKRVGVADKRVEVGVASFAMYLIAYRKAVLCKQYGCSTRSVVRDTFHAPLSTCPCTPFRESLLAVPELVERVGKGTYFEACLGKSAFRAILKIFTFCSR